MATALSGIGTSAVYLTAEGSPDSNRGSLRNNVSTFGQLSTGLARSRTEDECLLEEHGHPASCAERHVRLLNRSIASGGRGLRSNTSLGEGAGRCLLPTVDCPQMDGET